CLRSRRRAARSVGGRQARHSAAPEALRVPAKWQLSARFSRSRPDRDSAGVVESPGGLSPPGAPRSVREPLDSYGSRCSAVSMTELPVGEECWIYPAEPVKPVSCPLGLPTQPLELAARPADDIEIDPFQGWTQLRLVEVAVVVDPAAN